MLKSNLLSVSSLFGATNMERSKKNTLVLALCLTAALGCAVPCLAETIIVDANGNGRFTDIQSAIDRTETGDTVLVQPGEYAITEPITFRGKAITVRGESGPQETTLRASGNQSWYIAVVLFENGEGPGSLLEGLTLTGSLASGVFCVDSSPSLENCVITANYLCGVECLSASPTITNCTISGSVRESGVNCRDRSAPTITHCSISGNSAMGRGGGGVYCNDSSPNIFNCSISGNVAMSSGGGGVQCIRNSSLTLVNCSISGNSADEGGGVDCISSSLTLTNCIVWDNAGGAVSVDGTSNAQVTFSCIEGNELWPGLGNVNADPRFTYEGIFDFNRMEQVEIGGRMSEFPDYIVEAPDYHLLPGSPGTNAGTAYRAPQTDLDGKERLCDGRVDMGAYEMGDCAVAQVPLPLRGESGEMILGLGTLEDAVYSPDSKRIATSGSLGVFLWDAHSGALLHAFRGEGPVAFSPDSTQVLTASRDGTATLWDVDTGQEIRAFRGSSDIRSVVFAPDGTRVLTLTGDDEDKEATLWDADTGQEIHNFGLGEGGAAVFSPDGTRVLTGSRDATGTLWDAHTGQEIRSFSGPWHLGEIRSMVFSPDGTRVLTGSRDATAKLWDVDTGQEIRSFRGHSRDWDVFTVVFSPDGTQVLATDDGNGSATLWDAHTGQLIRTLRGSSDVE